MSASAMAALIWAASPAPPGSASPSA